MEANVPRDVLDVATEAALSAGRELIARYDAPAEGVGAKRGPADLVSDADRAAEQAIAAVLTRRRPHDGVLGEEGTANRAGTTGLRWIVDPLDGTVNYLCEDATGTLAGVVYDPIRDEVFSAVRGGSVRADGGSPRERELTRLEAAVVTGGVTAASAVGADAMWRRGR